MAKAKAKLNLGTASQQVRRSFDGFTRGQKTMLALAGAAVVLASLGLSRWAGREDYATLYSNLSASDAAAVTQSLDSTGISYRIGAAGTSILVPRDAVYRARIDLSAQGLPTDGSPGYALLDKQGITTSEFRQRVDYQRALEGELMKTIGAIDDIDASSVHLVIPQEDLFSGDAVKPSASVLVRTRGLKRLTGSQVQGIVHLVASSVEGLAPEDVTVTDAQGNVLAAPGQESSAAGSTRMEQTRAYEDALAASLQEMVQRTTGDGHAIVRVSAVMNYDKRSTTTETYADPATRTAIAERSTKETFTGAGGATSTGVLGANGTAGAPAAAANANDYQKEEVSSDYALGKVIEKIDAVPGTVSRLSIAVMLDKTRKVDTIALKKLVSAAAGLDTTRGDKLEVGELSFDTKDAKLAASQLALASKTEQQSQLFEMIKGVLLLLLALLSVFFAWRGAKKSSARTVDAIDLDSLPWPNAGALGSGDQRRAGQARRSRRQRR